ncbi:MULTISPECIES: hypothetical protein [Bacillales]|uniref:hypothetical protein n=1 Tax=Bacillales TaxID=1385 RepID=UPI00187C5E6B|nr:MULTISPECIES: hypothetical protein [Bacillales]
MAFQTEMKWATFIELESIRTGRFTKLIEERKDIMNKIIVEPKQGIGSIKLGMSRDDIRKYAEVNNIQLRTRCRASSVESFGDFKVEFDSGDRVIFIELSSYKGDKDITCLLFDINVFETKAEELAEQIDIISPYDRDDWELGYMYTFHDLGLAFWRPNVFTDEDMQQEWFLAHDAEEQETYLRDRYFRTVAVAVEGYWSKVL